MPSLHELQHELITSTFFLSLPVTRVIPAHSSYAVLDFEVHKSRERPANWWTETKTADESASDSGSEDNEQFTLPLLRPSVTKDGWREVLPQGAVGQVFTAWT